jgi:glycosyltransferase involved in cell wall biosynthesis
MDQPGNDLKICLVTPEFPPGQWGGLARTVEKVSWHAAEIGLQVHVAHIKVAADALVLLDENRQVSNYGQVKVHQITVGRETKADHPRQLWDCPHTLTLKMIYHSLEMLHAQEQFSLYHAFFLYPLGYITGLLAKRMQIPSIATIVGNDIKKYLFSPEKVAVCRSGLENADRVVALSQDLVDLAHSLTPIQPKARIIYNSVDLPAVSWEPLPASTRPFRLGCAGIFKYAKGLPYLLKAVAALRRTRHVELELVGVLRDEEKPVFTTMIQRTGISDILRFREPMPHHRMPDWLRSLDALVLPSVSEGCPNILMEAMATGLPCVATRTGANEVLIEHQVSGLLVPWGDSQSLAGAIEALIADPSLAAALGAAARIRMRYFSPARERAAWEAVYRQLLNF